MPTLAVTKHSPQANFGITFRDWIASLTNYNSWGKCLKPITQNSAHRSNRYTITYRLSSNELLWEFQPSPVLRNIPTALPHIIPGKTRKPRPTKTKWFGFIPNPLLSINIIDITSRYAIEISHSYLGNMKPSIKNKIISSGSVSYLVHLPFNWYVSPITYSTISRNSRASIILRLTCTTLLPIYLRSSHDSSLANLVNDTPWHKAQ